MTPLALHTVGLLAVGVGLLALDRRAWEGKNPEAPGTPSAQT